METILAPENAKSWLKRLTTECTSGVFSDPLFGNYRKDLEAPGTGKLLRDNWADMFSALLDLVNSDSMLTAYQQQHILGIILPSGRTPRDGLTLLIIANFIDSRKVVTTLQDPPITSREPLQDV